MAVVNIYGSEYDTTDYMYGVLDVINEDYAPVLHSLLPPGAAWVFEDGSEMDSLLRALSYTFTRVVKRGLDLLEEFDPRTTFELIVDWNRVLDLPGDNPSPATTTAGKRAAIHSRLLGHGDPTAAFFVEVAFGAGYTVVVKHKQYTPFVAGSPVGDPLTNNEWKFWWTVTYFPGDDDDLLEWSIENLVPSHTDVGFVQIGTDWVERDNPKNFFLYGICFGDLWVAVGAADGTDAYLLTSPNGIDWTERSNPKNFTLYGVAYDSVLDLYAAVGVSDGVDAYIATSQDGISWTERANDDPVDFYCVASNSAGRFVALGAPAYGGSYAGYSDDGVTWTYAWNPLGVDIYGVCWFPLAASGFFVAVGATVGGQAAISIGNGATWGSAETNPKNIALRAVAASSTLIVAVGDYDGADAYLITSPNGTTWTEQTNPGSGPLYAVAYVEEFGGFWIATGLKAGGDAYMITSSDGVNWVEVSNPSNNTLRAIAFDGVSQLASCGENDGTDAYLIISGLPD